MRRNDFSPEPTHDLVKVKEILNLRSVKTRKKGPSAILKARKKGSSAIYSKVVV
jgi:hypothetical protein